MLPFYPTNFRQTGKLELPIEIKGKVQDFGIASFEQQQPLACQKRKR